MTPKSNTTADQVRELGLSVGDVIIGREYWNADHWSESELTLTYIGKEAAVFDGRKRSSGNPAWRNIGESGNWNLSYRDLVKA